MLRTGCLVAVQEELDIQHVSRLSSVTAEWLIFNRARWLQQSAAKILLWNVTFW